MAALMWNHAPAMWSAMSAQGIARPNLSAQDSADLFAFFAASRYFDRTGEPSRGGQLLEARKCAGCHGPGGPGKPVNQWTSVQDPVSLATAMWNHAAQMKTALDKKRAGWVPLTAQELSDIAHYVRSQPGMRRMPNEFLLTPPGGGAALFKDKGCGSCHIGKMALENRLSAATLTDVAAAMWNHAPRMQRDTPTLSAEEMRELVGYIWSGPFFSGAGNAARGERVFARRQCGTCHGAAGSGAPDLKSPEASALTMVSGLFQHGPAMLDKLRQKNVAWPRFERNEMADLIAYLRASR
jgi:mono/diheme cytochrome c family protein